MTESSGACDAGWNGVAHRVLPILSLVVLSRVACVYWRASRLLSDGGETRDLINEKRIVDEVKTVVAEAGATPGQIVLAWLLTQDDDIAPIPGTKRVARRTSPCALRRNSI